MLQLGQLPPMELMRQVLTPDQMREYEAMLERTAHKTRSMEELTVELWAKLRHLVLFAMLDETNALKH